MNLAVKYRRKEKVTEREIAGESFLIPVCGKPVDMENIFILNPQKKNAKKAYQKPVLRVVSITAGVQTLGIGCKTASGGGYPTNPLAVPCWAIGCAQEGS